MVNNPKISVIMSVYNAEKYLHQAVDSILHQTFSDFEFIIIEDCSTDSSLQILEQYADEDSRILLIKKDKNNGKQGFIQNLNIGLDKARGEYIARMDADDISESTRFEKQLEAFNNDSEAFIIGSYLEFIDENSQPLQIKTAPTNDKDIKDAMLQNIALYHPVIMFKNSPLRYREKMLGCEDYDLFFRMILEGKKMKNLPEVLLKYRILKNSISRQDQNFIRWSFVEKARAFYNERLITGKDSYQDFNPENFQKLLDLDIKNTEKDLLLAFNTALKFSLKNELKLIAKKIKRHYPETSSFRYTAPLYLPVPLLKFYSKLMG